VINLLAAMQSGDPVIVRIVQPKEPGVAEVLIGALGITGVLVVGALVIGIVIGGALFWLRSRRL
jgi:hypothetical protein